MFPIPNKIIHRFHLVDPSYWPFYTSLSVFILLSSSVLYFHSYIGGFFFMMIGFFSLIINTFFWFRDVIREGTFEGKHYPIVQEGLKLGMILFIVSEIMFFFGFFWAFFHSSLSPAMELGGVWPPVGIRPFETWKVPFLNTLILLMSGATVTWAHHGFYNQNYKEQLIGFLLTLFLAVFFTIIQVMEYKSASFSIYDSIYGSTFFMATGFHGFHVIIGSLFLFTMMFRTYYCHFVEEFKVVSKEKYHAVGVDSAIWYWHFVDVVWLFLFITIYWWGGKNFFFDQILWDSSNILILDAKFKV